jgi:hypothetical protein
MMRHSFHDEIGVFVSRKSWVSGIDEVIHPAKNVKITPLN